MSVIRVVWDHVMYLVDFSNHFIIPCSLYGAGHLDTLSKKVGAR